MTHHMVLEQLHSVIGDLIRLSLCDRQNYPSERTTQGGVVEITFLGAEKITAALRNQPYRDIYDELNRHDAYSIKMLDGALVQMSYCFSGENLIKHRLAFFPSPHLEDFQNEPEIYEDDEIFADILAKNIVPFPLRFDFDSDDELFQELDHPRSHLTLGQFKNCRIPVTAPLSPFQFVSFILRNFYNTAHRKYSGEIAEFKDAFPETIAGTERQVLHVQVQSGA